MYMYALFCSVTFDYGRNRRMLLTYLTFIKIDFLLHDTYVKQMNSPGSMGPKIQAAINFVQNSSAAGRKHAWAAIGDLRDAAKIIKNEEGTIIREDESLHNTGVIWRVRRDTTAAGETKSPRLSSEPHKSG